MGPRDSVSCPKFAGHPTLPAECCVLRTLWKRSGRAKHKFTYPICATCPLGRLRRQKLEANGWRWDEQEWRLRNSARLKAEKRAQRAVEHVAKSSPLVPEVEG